ncbi:hypothetical protein, partial [uncultured Thiohalocapsa sp.]|uniref:hypothetical protein n=1 Tax=uncultured Thiohalocapsa sp. TaxID=768990 RepID=UPI0025DDB5F9
ERRPRRLTAQAPMSIPHVSAPPKPGSAQRRLVTAWVAEQTERLQPAEARALDAERPDWRAQAAQLIAEGLLAYVVLEMVAPDIAIARRSGGHADDTALEAGPHTDDATLAERLVAHLQDFIDYRDELTERGGLTTTDPCAKIFDHQH